MDVNEGLLTLARQSLETHLGLNVDTLGLSALIVAVRARLMALGLPADAYASRLATTVEVEALIEEIIVPETWFFRDVKPFECLRHYLRQPKSGRVRLLSFPSSTGEEPYSLAMTLLAAGLAPEQIEVHGVDVCQRSLARGREAVYPSASFRETDANVKEILARYTRPHRNGTEIAESVRNLVTFRHGNLLNPMAFASTEPFHFICCRNVLIYMHQEARERALRNLHRQLLPEGVLYVGHTEGSIPPRTMFRFYAPEFPFAFCKIAESGGKKLESESKRAWSTPVGGSGEHTPLPKEDDRFSRARDRADTGDLKGAAELCDQILAHGSPQPEPLHLLGVIRQAQGNLVEARRCFEKVLYLQPRHRDALWRMSLLMLELGEDRSAAQYRRRAESVE